MKALKIFSVVAILIVIAVISYLIFSNPQKESGVENPIFGESKLTSGDNSYNTESQKTQIEVSNDEQKTSMYGSSLVISSSSLTYGTVYDTNNGIYAQTKFPTAKQPSKTTEVSPVLVKSTSSGPILDPKTASFKEYGNKLAAILIEKSPSAAELSAIFDPLVKNPTPDVFAKLPGLAQKYSNLSSTIDTITPPTEVTNVHIGLKTAFYTLSTTVPVLGSQSSAGKVDMQNFITYNNSVKELVLASNNLVNFFRDNKIVFSQNEKGYIFNTPEK